MTTATDVANLALGLLHMEPINSIDESDYISATTMAFWLPITRREVLTEFNFSFAVLKRAVAVEDGNIITPPIDMIKLIKIGYQGDVKYELVNGAIYLLSSSYYPGNLVELYYVVDVTNYTDWDHAVVMLLAYTLAVRTSHILKPNSQLLASLAIEKTRMASALTAALGQELGDRNVLMDPYSGYLNSSRLYFGF